MEKLKVFAKDPLYVPRYATAESAGLDLRADKLYTIKRNEVTKVGVGIQVKIPEGYVGLVYPRSGLATKEGLVLANGVGVIDSDYTGPIMCMMTLESWSRQYHFVIEQGDRIAQMVIQPVVQVGIQPVKTESLLGKTERGSGGFGHTGKK